MQDQQERNLLQGILALSKVKNIFPANDFDHVMEQAKGEYEYAIIIGYDKEGYLDVRAGGLNSGRQPTAKDWLFAVEQFKRKLLSGDYSD